MLEFLRAAESAPGSLDAAEPFKRVVGLLLDDEESTGSSAMSGPAPENSRVPYGPQR